MNAQAYDRLEVLEATCEAVYSCHDSLQPIVELSEAQINEVYSVFSGSLIPK